MRSMSLFVVLVLGLSAVSRAADLAPRKVWAADYGAKRLALIDAAGQVAWETSIQDIHDFWILANGNILFQRNFGEVVEMTPKQEIVWRYDGRANPENAGKKVEIHAFQRLENGDTMVAESGPMRILEVNKAGEIVRRVPLTVDQPDPHRDTRLVRKLACGNYLACHEKDETVREYDATGKVVWSYKVGSQVYSAERLANGNTLIGTGGGHSVVEVNPAGKTVWSLSQADLKDAKLAWVTMVERLANGNTRLVNCHAGPDQPQILEVTPGKELVWSFRDFKKFGNNLPVARVIDTAK